MSDIYKSIASASEGLFRDNGSRFLAFAYPVETEDEIKERVDALRKKYHDARHWCYAWRLGLDGSSWRASDDGEPAHSAGSQILGQIDSAGLSDILVVVVRYFGGIKLGIPGLIRAYRTSTRDALDHAETVEKVAGSFWKLDFPYSAMPAVMKALKDMDIPTSSQDFGESCSLRARVRLTSKDAFLERLSHIEDCSVSVWTSQ